MAIGEYAVKIVIIRHGEVDYKMRKWSNSEEVSQDYKMYDQAPVISAEYNVPKSGSQAYYVSSLSRTLETAKAMFGEQDYIVSELIDEVPLSASIETKLRLPLVFWNITGRIQWLFNNKRQKESRKETIIRAERFVEDLVSKNEDCAIVTHGFFMITLLNVMKKKGFYIKGKSSGFANGEYTIAEI